MKNQSLLLLILSCQVFLFGCQKSGNNHSDPVANPMTVNNFGFTDQLNRMSCGDYQFNENINGVACTTQLHHYGTRAELCHLLANEAVNQNCAVMTRRQLYNNYCQNGANQNMMQQNLPVVNGATCSPLYLPGNTVATSGFPPNNNFPGNPNLPIQNPVTIGNPTLPISNQNSNLKLVTCSTLKKSHREILNGFINLNQSVSDSVTVNWDMKAPKSEILRRLRFSSGLVKLDLLPGGPKDPSLMKLTYQKLNDQGRPESLVSIQGATDSGVTLQVQTEQDSADVQINCFMVQGQNAMAAVGHRLSCDGQGSLPSGEKFSINQSYPWGLGSVINQEFPLGNSQLGVVKIYVSPTQNLSQAPTIQLAIPRFEYNAQDLDVVAVGSLTNSGVLFSQKEKISRFSLDLSCRLAQ